MRAGFLYGSTTVENEPNQIWSSDITYIRLAHGFVYLVAIIDVFSGRRSRVRCR